jgi:ATP-dependent RNA helicase DeaD
MTFPTVHPALDRALAARAYATPTAVQLAVLQVDARARDVLVSAQTGSGKTVAFGIAISATLLADAEQFGRAAEPLALIIAPTRELALQVQRELTWLYAETGATIITCVGGMDARAESRQLGAGAHIVVGTPGRLRDHIERQRLDLSRLKAIVLDEADEMLDLGFREDLEFILQTTPAKRQTLLFSATMPRDIETLAKRYQRDALRIETGRRDEQHVDIAYRALKVAPNDVDIAIVNVLRYYESRAALVFCATREAVKRMHARLVERGFAAVALSGELTQHERTQALVAVRDGRARVLVATDVAARGLDLPDLALVIHGDLPNDRETLLHRSGRTGRAGKKGMCVLIVPYHRRRKAEMLLGAARLQVTWAAAPTVDEVRNRDQERFLSDPLLTESATEPDAALARRLQEVRTADEIALALVRLYRTRLPEPEDLAEDVRPPRRDDRPRRPDRDGPDARPHAAASRDWDRDGGAHGDADRGLRQPRGRGREDATRLSRPRATDGRGMVWFRLNIGHERNADPKWLLPLICKAGGVSKSAIGTIRIFERDTRFEIAADQADAFAEAVRTNKHKEGYIARVRTLNAADDAAVAEALEGLRHREDAAFAAGRRDERADHPWRDVPKHGRGSGPVSKPLDNQRRPGLAALGADSTVRRGPDSRYLEKRKHRGGQA